MGNLLALVKKQIRFNLRSASDSDTPALIIICHLRVGVVDVWLDDFLIATP